MKAPRAQWRPDGEETDAAIEVQSLRRTLRDVVALSALPSIWADYDLPRSLQNLIDVLRATLRAYTVCVRVKLPDGTDFSTAASRGLSTEPNHHYHAADLLEAVEGDASELCEIARFNGSGPLNALPHPLFFGGERIGHLVACYKIDVIPAQSDRLLLQVAANQVTLLFQRHKDQERAQKALAAKVQQQRAVAELGLLALRESNLQVLFDRAVSHIARTLEVEYCKVLELLPGGDAVLLRAGVGWKDGLVGNAIVSTGQESQAGYTLTCGEPVVVEDLRTETRFNGPQLLHDHAVVSGLSCIIVGDGGPWGVLGAHTKCLREFPDEDVAFLQAVANVLATSIQRKRTEQALHESNALLESQKDAFQAAMRGSSLEESLEVLVRRIIEFTGGRARAAFYIAHSDGKALRHVIGMPEYYAKAVENFPISAESMACGLAVHTGRPEIAVDVEQDPKWESFRWLARHHNFRACWSFPVRTKDSVANGTMAMYFQEPCAPTQRELEMATVMAHAATVIISRHQQLAERERAEQALRLSSRLLAENPAPVLRVSRDRTLHFANPKAQEFLAEWNARIGDPAPAPILELIGDANRHSAEMSIGERFYTVAVVPVLEGVFINLYFNDITDRKLAEGKLRESEERYRQLVSLLPAGVYSCDATGRLTFFNRRAAQLWGREPALDGSERFCACYKLFLPDGTYVPPHETPMAMAVGEGKSFRNVEATVERPDGTRFVASVNIDPVKDQDGNVRGAINVFHDITDQRQAEDELRENRRQLAADAKALGRLNELGSRLWQTSNLHEGINETLNATIAMLGADMGNIQLLKGDTLRIAAQRGFKDDFLEFFREVSAEDDSACGRALRNGERIIIQDVEADQAYAPMRDVARSAGYRAVQSTPLIGRDGKPRGMISTHWRSPHQPDERQLRHLNLYVRQAADFIERCEIESALRESDERFRNIFNQTTAGIAQVDLNGRFLFVNQRFCEITGFSAEELRTKTCAELTFAGDQAFNREKFENALREAKPFFIEKRYVRPDGSLVWVRNNVSQMTDASGNVCRLLAVSVDITEQKRAQESAARLAAIVEHSDDAIFSTDLEGKITSWNTGAERLYGFSAAEAIGQSITMTLPQGRADEQPEILHRIHQGESVENYETQRRRKDGTIIDVSLTVSPIKDAADKVIGVSKVARDITDKVRARETLERTVAERTAQLLDTVAELEAFSYSIAHDMRAPLRAMNSYSRLLEDDFSQALPAEAKHFTKRIAAGASRLDSLITDVLNYSKIARGEMTLESLDVERLIRDIVDSYPSLSEANATILVQSSIPPVVGNTAALTQCISNLLSNAIKFVAPGTTPRVIIRAERKFDCVRLWFEDNGIGISEEGRHRIFRMFQRLNPATAFDGTGIGLTIVRKAVDRMGGKVGVESQPGVGSQFWIELKCAA